MEMAALIQSLLHVFAVHFQHLNPGDTCDFARFAAGQLVILVNRVVAAVQEEVNEIRHYHLGPLVLQHLNEVIVGGRVVLDQNFPDDSDLGDFLLNSGQAVKVLDNLSDIALKDRPFRLADINLDPHRYPRYPQAV